MRFITASERKKLSFSSTENFLRDNAAQKEMAYAREIREMKMMIPDESLSHVEPIKINKKSQTQLNWLQKQQQQITKQIQFVQLSLRCFVVVVSVVWLLSS